MKTAAGQTVTLDPSTTLARRWLSETGANASRFTQIPSDTLFVRARHTTTALADGSFEFSELPAGVYIVRTMVTWEAPSMYSGLTKQGGLLADTVTVGSTGTARIVLHETVSDVGSTSSELPLVVPVIDAAHIAGRKFTTIAPVSRSSTVSERFTLARMSLDAAKLDANAITNVECRMSTQPMNGIVTYECKGDAVKWEK